MARQVRTRSSHQALSRAVDQVVQGGHQNSVQGLTSRRRAVAVAGVIALAASGAHAGVSIQTTTAAIDVPWQPTTVLPRVNTIDYVPGETADAPGSWTNPVPEYFFVTAQTFKATNDFRLGKVNILGAASGTFTGSIHLYDLGDLGATPVPANYNLSTINGGSATPDLFGAGSGLSIGAANGLPRSMIEFLFSGSDQVQLQANHTYVFETWRNANQDAANTLYWERLGGNSAIPPNPAPPTGNPYALGDSYSATAGTDNTIVRSQINGAGRDLIMAVFDTSALPPLQVDINGGPSNHLRPNQAGFIPWGSGALVLPSTGNGADPDPQGGYPIHTISQSFGTGIAASGTVTATLTSVDVGGTSAPAYIMPGPAADNPRINTRDYSIAGREFDNSGGFTATKDFLYRDLAMAEQGTTSPANNGTNHRMEIQFDGLDANTPYKVKLYAYDNSNQRSVQVFTDVTAQPLIFMPSAQSGNGTFTPGDGGGGTQYAPAGQYIDGLTVPTFPVGDDFGAITLYATTDATGKLVFAQTTVTGLTGDTQVLPVLNGFEIEKDQRSWAGGTGSNWNEPANWTGGLVPNTKGQVANFGNTANTAITIDAPTTVARLNFSGSGITIGGGSTLTLDDTSINSTLSFNVTGRTEINLTSTSANQTINAPLVLAKDTQVSVASAATTLTVSNLQPAAVTLTKGGAGTLAVNNVRSNALRVFGGTVKVLPNSTAAGVSRVGALTVAAGKLDLTDNKLIVTTPNASGSWNGSAYTGVAGLVDTGRGSAGNAMWDGASGIVTSDTRAINNGDLVSIGVAKVSEVRTVADTATTTFAGQNVLGSDTIAMATWGGDANLDGKINIDDYGRIDGNVGQSGSVFGWSKGDFNYDGKINIDDYGIIDGNINRQGAVFATSGSALDGVAAIPEPSALSLVALGGLTLLRRRRGA